MIMKAITSLRMKHEFESLVFLLSTLSLYQLKISSHLQRYGLPNELHSSQPVHQGQFLDMFQPKEGAPGDTAIPIHHRPEGTLASRSTESQTFHSVGGGTGDIDLFEFVRVELERNRVPGSEIGQPASIHNTLAHTPSHQQSQSLWLANERAKMKTDPTTSECEGDAITTYTCAFSIQNYQKRPHSHPAREARQFHTLSTSPYELSKRNQRTSLTFGGDEGNFIRGFETRLCPTAWGPFHSLDQYSWKGDSRLVDSLGDDGNPGNFETQETKNGVSLVAYPAQRLSKVPLDSKDQDTYNFHTSAAYKSNIETSQKSTNCHSPPKNPVLKNGVRETGVMPNFKTNINKFFAEGTCKMNVDLPVETYCRGKNKRSFKILSNSTDLKAAEYLSQSLDERKMVLDPNEYGYSDSFKSFLRLIRSGIIHSRYSMSRGVCLEEGDARLLCQEWANHKPPYFPPFDNTEKRRYYVKNSLLEVSIEDFEKIEKSQDLLQGVTCFRDKLESNKGLIKKQEFPDSDFWLEENLDILMKKAILSMKGAIFLVKLISSIFPNHEFVGINQEQKEAWEFLKVFWEDFPYFKVGSAQTFHWAESVKSDIVFVRQILKSVSSNFHVQSGCESFVQLSWTLLEAWLGVRRRNLYSNISQKGGKLDVRLKSIVGQFLTYIDRRIHKTPSRRRNLRIEKIIQLHLDNTES